MDTRQSLDCTSFNSQNKDQIKEENDEEDNGSDFYLDGDQNASREELQNSK